MKQVCIIGLGQFGSHLARTLAKLRCDVLALDRHDDAVAQIRDEVQHAAVLDARSLDALKAVVTPEIDEAVICFGEHLEASVLCALHLSKIGIKKISAKATNQDHARILEAVGATNIIFPEQETAERMAQRIINPDLLDCLPLSPEYQVVERTVPRAFAGQTLIGLHLRKKYSVLAIAVRPSPGGTVQFMPPADHVLPAAGSLFVLGKADDIASLPE